MQGMMEGQLNIFDFLQPDPMPDNLPDFHGMEVDEIVQIISARTGLRFVWTPHLKAWQHKRTADPKGTLEIYLGHYKTYDDRNGMPYISVHMIYKLGGWASPCDSLREAIQKILDEQKRWRGAK